MDGEELGSLDRALLIDGLANDIHNSTQGLGANGHHDWVASVSDLLASDETFSGVEGDSSDVVATEMLGNLEDESVVDTLDLQGVKNRGEVSLELDVYDCANDLGDLSN